MRELQGVLCQCAAAQLTSLDVSDNVLTSAGLDVLVASVLSPGSPLTALHLRNNWLGTDGMIKLADAVRAHVGLRHLDVSNQGARPKDFSRVDTSQLGLLEMFKSLLVCLCGIFFLSHFDCFNYPRQHVLIVDWLCL